MSNVLLEVKNLKTTFHTSHGLVKAVDGISFSIPEGGAVGIVGESGSGKSMTALSLLRLVPPPGHIAADRIFFGKAGQYKNLLDIDPTSLRQLRGKQISIVFQEPASSLNPVFTLGNQIEEVFQLHEPRLRRDERRRKVHESLELVQIADPERVSCSYPHEVSGGMKQRVMIAMALACRPDLLIADEPTTALDVTVQAEILELLRTLRKKLGMALLLITHDMGVAAEMVDQLLVMCQGQIVESGETEKVLRSPVHSYTQRLLEVYGRLARR